MAKVAICGFAPNTLPRVNTTDADEIWALVWAYKYPQFPRIDRLFELHPIWIFGKNDKREYVKPREHWLWLQQNRSIPVYMTNPQPEVPRALRYPIEEVEALLAGWTRSGEQLRMFTSSVDYMIGLALLEEWDEIELIGVEMSSDTEYRYQRESLGFWMGVAVGRGVKVTQHAPTQLFYKPKRYGYDSFEMIQRQSLERLKDAYIHQHQDAMARLQFKEGQVAAAQETLNAYEGDDPFFRNRLMESLIKRQQEREAIKEKAAIASGALQTVDYLLKEVDLEDPSDQLFSPFNSIAAETNGAN